MALRKRCAAPCTSRRLRAPTRLAWNAAPLLCTYDGLDRTSDTLRCRPLTLSSTPATHPPRRAWAETVVAGLGEEAQRLQQSPDFLKFGA